MTDFGRSGINGLLLKLSIAACALSILVFSFFLFQSNQIKNSAKAVNYGSDQVILAVNKERQKKNLKPLVVNSQLQSAAQKKAEDMANKSYFSHISPVDGRRWSDFIKESGYNYVEAGENLANGFDTVGEMVEAWMNSPSHRENILNATAVETGLGIAFGKLDNYPTIFVAQVFGRQATQSQPTTSPTPSNPNPLPQQSPPEQKEENIQEKTLGELLTLPEIKIEQ